MPVFLVKANTFDEKPIFKRVVYAKTRNEAVGVALHEENRTRDYTNRVERSKMWYSVAMILAFVPELDTPVGGKGNQPKNPVEVTS